MYGLKYVIKPYSWGKPSSNSLISKILSINNQEFSFREKKKNMPKLRTIDDLPDFLKNSNLDENEALSILTKFLINDDIKIIDISQASIEAFFDIEKTGKLVKHIIDKHWSNFKEYFFNFNGVVRNCL